MIVLFSLLFNALYLFPVLPFSKNQVVCGEGKAIVVWSLNVSDILSKAKERFHVHGDAILEHVVRPGLVAECDEEFVDNESYLAFQPQYFNAQFQFRTLAHTSSLRLLAQRVAQETGKIGGSATRVSDISIMVEVHAVDSALIESFIVSMTNTEGIQIVR